MIAWLLISFFVLLFLGVPIAMSLGLSAMGGILFLGGGSTVTIAQRMFEGMNSFALLAIPLYTFAGFTMSKGGISKRLMDFCYSIVGHIYGGLAHAVPSTPIELVRRLTEHDVTPGTLDTAFSTRVLHAAQLMPVTVYCSILLFPPVFMISGG